MSHKHHLPWAAAAVILQGFVASAPTHAQQWPSWGNDPGGMKYAALDQINKENVSRLKVAWSYDTGDATDGNDPERPNRSAHESTPLVVDGVLYLTTPFDRLFALDPETGKALWVYDPKTNLRDTRFGLYIHRGAAFWSGGDEKRILLAINREVCTLSTRRQAGPIRTLAMTAFSICAPGSRGSFRGRNTG